MEEILLILILLVQWIILAIPYRLILLHSLSFASYPHNPTWDRCATLIHTQFGTSSSCRYSVSTATFQTYLLFPPILQRKSASRLEIHTGKQADSCTLHIHTHLAGAVLRKHAHWKYIYRGGISHQSGSAFCNVTTLHLQEIENNMLSKSTRKCH